MIIKSSKGVPKKIMALYFKDPNFKLRLETIANNIISYKRQVQ